MNGFTLNLKQRLAAAYCSLGLLCILLAILGIKGLEDANVRAQRTYETVTRPGQHVESSSIMTLGRAIQLMEVLALTDEGARQQRLQSNPYRADQTLGTVWERALAAAKKAEEEVGIENLGPWDDFEWGMLNGKLSALRWTLGDEWDMLDT